MLALVLESEVGEYQRGFAEAIFSHDAPIPTRVRNAPGNACLSRFGVYRNNVIASLIGAIGSRYPICRKLLWPETFDGAARLYVMSEPPRSPVLLHYGDSFPGFLRRIGAGAATEYVADIAELETARVRAYHSADADPLSIDVFSQLSDAVLPELNIRLHPSVTLVQSSFPIVSAWDTAMQDGDAGQIVWRPEAALISRSDDRVEVRILPAGGFAFFSEIQRGGTVAEVVERATRQDGAFDLAACFAQMISARIVTDLSRKEARA